MNTYTPRRASKSRWLQDAPEYILDCFIFPKDGGPEVLFTGSLLCRCGDGRQNTAIMGLCSTGSFELKPHEAANFRYANGKRRVRWMDIPEGFRNRVIAWATQD